ncbi:cytochrome P450 [Streptomyces sp. NBC_00820]|uniref:cytochrome P450 n=1 Tax=Streptomyces sp. NBC_00820 TaxID=2975842 RepID=UPI002ED58D42|nr:cytochrome P450 [Streptomyces sp. NBC_00820]
MNPHSPPAAQCPPGAHTSPSEAPLPIHGPEFDADPHATYRRLRLQGPIAPVEIAPGVYGYLAVTYRAVVHLLRNSPKLFAKDPTTNWEALRDGRVPADSPARMMMQPRDNALWKDGEEHLRLRGAITSALARVDTYAVTDAVARIADQLVDTFSAAGEADLVGQYADPLSMLTVIDLFSCPPELGERIVHAVTRLFAAGPDAADANADLESACLDLVRLKRDRPGRDIVTYLVQTGLGDEELVQTLLLVFGAAAPPAGKHIARGVQRYLTDERFSGSVHTGIRPVAAALEEVLWDDPPVANYCPLYAQGTQRIDHVLVEPGYPILCSFAAANRDPELAVAPDERVGNRAHLAFSAGPHACPAPGLARVISETAVERLLDRLTGLSLAIDADRIPPLPGTFLAGPAALPVRFQPHAPLAPAGK